MKTLQIPNGSQIPLTKTCPSCNGDTKEYCSECDQTGEVLTENGLAIIDLLNPIIEYKVKEVLKMSSGRRVRDLF